MPAVDLKARVSRLEQQLKGVLQTLSLRQDPEARKTDIERAAGFFGDDRFMKRVMKAALKYREEDRKKARQPKAKTRRPKT